MTLSQTATTPGAFRILTADNAGLVTAVSFRGRTTSAALGQTTLATTRTGQTTVPSQVHGVAAMAAKATDGPHPRGVPR